MCDAVTLSGRPYVVHSLVGRGSAARRRAIAPTLIYDSKIADAAYPNQKWPERFRSNKVPSLLLDGEKTIPMIPVGMNALRKVLANSSRKTLAGQDHDPETEAIAPVIRQFLQP